MKSLPPAVPREPSHTRSIVYRSYLRHDGLWDIEAGLTDTKAFPVTLDGRDILPEQPIHGMRIRITVDDAMVVRAVVAEMTHWPFNECRSVLDPMRRLVGLGMGPGWRKRVDEAIGGTRGCTHMREMLYGAASAAYQTVTPHRDYEVRRSGREAPPLRAPPGHLGKCMALTVDGAVVRRVLPKFYLGPANATDEKTRAD